jgi:hypothetical protein
VDLVGFEPTTSSMPWKRAPNCATGPHYAVTPQYEMGSNPFIVPQLLELVKPVLR